MIAKAAGSPLATVPTLDAIAGRPELVRELPHQVLVDLAFTALRVQAALHLALAVAAPGPVPRADDDLLTVDQAAAILRIGKSTLEHGARTTYKSLRVEMPGRGLRFSRLAIQKWIQRHKAVS